jgi:hypothetical protein
VDFISRLFFFRGSAVNLGTIMNLLRIGLTWGLWFGLGKAGGREKVLQSGVWGVGGWG